MHVNNRKSEFDILGDIPWGIHLCYFYHTKQDLINILIPYLKSGMDENEYCVYVSSNPLGVAKVRAALGKVIPDLGYHIKQGQIEIMEYSQWYIKSGKFDSNKALQCWLEKEEVALGRGFDGLRLAGNTFWIERTNPRIFSEYEEAVEGIIAKHKIIALCSYWLDQYSIEEIVNVASNHSFSLIGLKRKEEPTANAKGRLVEIEPDRLAPMQKMPVKDLSPRTNSLVEGLTVRQQEVLRLIAKGYNNASIAKRLDLSLRSVETYISSIYQKLNLTENPSLDARVQAALMYLQEEETAG